ncbi:MAG: 16S rRNA (cytosine(967)-C(5))-methyltransferase RsmB, partial [Bacillota bacterium]|nr:16S rRNA (cytosine(967)-C(5))-methyltransferase RsmB [Bacillota bacterium]
LASEIGEQGAKGFINAVLRAFIRRNKKVAMPEDADRRMSVYYSHPLWLVRYWIALLGEEKTERLLESNNAKPPLTLRINDAVISVEEYLNLLDKKGIEATKTELSKVGVRIISAKGMKIQEFPGYDKGYFVVQDESSQLAIETKPPRPQDVCIDVCCSPGGKTMHMAQHAATVHGFDISKQRLGVTMKNVLRLGLQKKVKLDLVDATKGVREFNDTADYVLVDAPCSALGTIRRNPDIKYNRLKTDIAKNAKTQKIILKRAAQYVKSGGTLIYSTCTVTREENEEQVAKFLGKHEDFVLVCERQLLPFVDGTDGFYFAVMERK